MRYYTQCRFTPTVHENRYRSVYMYPQAPTGYLFHDTEKVLDIDHVLKALFRLSKLHENAKQAHIISVNEQTLVATFSLCGFPLPTVAKTYNGTVIGEYPLQTSMSWLVRDVTDLSKAPVEKHLQLLYDNCTELPRLTGNCPCPLRDNGQCLSKNVLPHLPEEFTPETFTRNFSEVPLKAFKAKPFDNLNGFEYVSPGNTTDKDFTIGLRAWDEHDFADVVHRKHEFSVRGKRRSEHTRYRKETCSQCAFRREKSTKTGTIINDCGMIHACNSHTTESQAWQALQKWYDASGFENMKGFTPEQRDYLLREGATPKWTKCITGSRRTQAILGYFTQPGYYKTGWKYRICAGAGDRTRSKDFESYDDLCAEVPHMPDVPKPVPLSYKAKLASAAFGTNYILRRSWGRTGERYYVKATDDRVYGEWAGGRWLIGNFGLDLEGSDVKDWVTQVFGYAYNEIPNKLR